MKNGNGICMLVKLSITSDYCFNELANNFHEMIRHGADPVGFFWGSM